MEYDKTINKENIKKFKAHDIFFDTENKKFKCVLCKRKVAISDSSSITGYFLICNTCTYEKFGNYAEARKWQKQEMDEFMKKEVYRDTDSVIIEEGK